ncbi:hypothetical protein EIN_379980 [Entamoeba invadens IP1]|uniref:Uncharacterized protein n=1 Tax=Entamoeba invadens IP1 TaxID=370355 RepID=A0A0A1UE92_ENTIV|nr:hypothetical protein EIN_379980 [Entamoeba invadens IP1]ELP92101.1 hypothetical protein EIN_379980 [Entamoeba invadens IP1]|eukprot:XP_004258872.1 hypothetical protein EIN_379980 [Entamoeba invadens IP1]
MSKQITLKEEITNLQRVGKSTVITTSKTSLALWDVVKTQSLKSVMFPPGEEVLKSDVYIGSGGFSVFSTTSNNAVLFMTKQSFDYAKAVKCQMGGATHCVRAVSDKVCYVGVGPKLYNVSFENSVPAVSLICAFAGAVLAIHVTSQKSYVIFEKGGKIAISSLENGKVVKSLDLPCETMDLSFFVTEFYIINKNDSFIVPINLDSFRQADLVYKAGDQNADYTMLCGAKTQLKNRTYGTEITSFPASDLGVFVDGYVVMYLKKESTLKIEAVTQRDCLFSSLLKTADVKQAISFDDLKQRKAMEIENDGTTTTDEDVEKFVKGDAPTKIKMINNWVEQTSPTLLLVWEVLESRMKEDSFFKENWGWFKVFVQTTFTADTEKVFEELKKQKKVDEMLELAIGMTELPDDVLVDMLKTCLKDKKSDLASLLNRNLNTQTTSTLVLSKLSSEEAKTLFEFLIEEIQTGDNPVSYTVNWLIALLDAKASLMITDESFVEALRKAEGIINGQVHLVDLCEELFPYVDQVMQKRELPLKEKSDYVVFDLF